MRRKTGFFQMIVLLFLLSASGMPASRQADTPPEVSPQLLPVVRPQPETVHISYLASIRKEAPFLVSGQNWRQVLALVPVSTWRSPVSTPIGTGTKIQKVPVLIYHEETKAGKTTILEISPGSKLEYFGSGKVEQSFSSPAAFIESIAVDAAVATGYSCGHSYRLTLLDGNGNTVAATGIMDTYDPIKGTFNVPVTAGASYTLKIEFQQEGPCETTGNTRVYLRDRSLGDEDYLDGSLVRNGTVQEDRDLPLRIVGVYGPAYNHFFDIDAVVNYLKTSGSRRLHVVGELRRDILDILTAPPPEGAGLAAGNIKMIDAESFPYFFFEGPKVAVVCQDDYSLGLSAAVYASYLNAPLFFDGHFDDRWLEGRDVVTVGNVESVQGNEHYGDVEELQKRLIRLTGTRKAVLVNSRDRVFEPKLFPVPPDDELCLGTRYGGEVSRLFYRLSLAAPFLAAARGAIIIDIKNIPYLEYILPYEGREFNPPYVVTDYKDILDYLAGFYRITDWQPQYLTIMSDFAHVEYQVPRQKHNTLGFERPISLPADTWFYADPNLDGYPDIYVGRMMGYTLSDLSAWVARTIFYRPPRNHHSLFLGPSADVHGESKAAAMYDAAAAFGGTDASYILGSEEIDAAARDWKDKHYISFRDHGSYSDAGLGYRDIRDTVEYFTHSPILDIDACLTAFQFWMDKESGLFANVAKSFSLHLVRHGALAYIGAQMPHGGHIPWPLFYTWFADDRYQTLGKTYYDFQLRDTMVYMQERGVFQKRGAGDLKTSFQQYTLWGDPALKPGSFIEYGERDRLEAIPEKPFQYRAFIHYYAPDIEIMRPTVIPDDEGRAEIEDYDKDYYHNDYLFFAGPYAWSKEGKYVFDLGPFDPDQRFEEVEVLEISDPSGSYPIDMSVSEIVKEYVVNREKYVWVYLQDQSLPYVPGAFTHYRFLLKLIPAGGSK